MEMDLSQLEPNLVVVSLIFCIINDCIVLHIFDIGGLHVNIIYILLFK